MKTVAKGLWDRGSNNPVHIYPNQVHPIGEWHIFDVRPGEEVIVFGRLWEKDPVSDDFMGQNEAKIHYDQIGETPKIVLVPFQEFDQRVQAIFTLKQNI